MVKIREQGYPFMIAFLAAMLLIPFLGAVHLFDWDEINFAESAREMIVSGDYLTVQINYLPFWEKPPLFIWMQVISMKLLGINEFAARFPNAIGGVITLLVLYLIGRKLKNAEFGLVWVLVYAGSILPHLYFRSGIIDPWFNLFIFLGIYFLFVYTRQETGPLMSVVLSSAFVGLAILTKGPVALLIFGLTALVWMILRRSWPKFFDLRFSVVFMAVLISVGGSWFLLQVITGNVHVIMDFIRYQVRLFTHEDAGHGGFPLYHVVVLFVGVFPASVFALPAFRPRRSDGTPEEDFGHWMLITFWVVLILFSIVNTKIVHYSSMCYFPLSFLAARVIHSHVERRSEFPAWVTWIAGGMAVVLGTVPILVQLFIGYKAEIIASGMIKDDFAVGNLEAAVHWSGWEFMTGVVLILGVLLSLRLFRRQPARQFVGVFVSSLLFVSASILVFAPRVEGYSQRAAVEFFKSKAGEGCYMDTWGYKSYAHYFYGAKQPPLPPRADQRDRLLQGSIDKRVYVSAKRTKAEEFSARYPDFTKLYEKNGFVFYYRDPGLNSPPRDRVPIVDAP